MYMAPADIKEAIARVDIKRVYNVSEMRRDNLFPWLATSNPQIYVNAIVDDKFHENVLKTKVSGQGRGREYRIKGANIVNYLKAKIKSQNGVTKRNERGSSST